MKTFTRLSREGELQGDVSAWLPVAALLKKAGASFAGPGKDVRFGLNGVKRSPLLCSVLVDAVFSKETPIARKSKVFLASWPGFG
jgi:hypothetical protein